MVRTRDETHVQELRQAGATEADEVAYRGLCRYLETEALAARPSRKLQVFRNTVRFEIRPGIRPAFVGDGAMQMNGINGLITISKYWQQWKDPRLVVGILNNQDLNQVTWEQRVLAGDPEYTARFHREARLVAKLEHPHVVAPPVGGGDDRHPPPRLPQGENRRVRVCTRCISAGKIRKAG